MIDRGFHIRDTLVLPSKLKELSSDNVAEILKIRDEFNALNYIDFRTEIGPDQVRRLTVNQKKRLNDAMLKAFELESKVRELLKTPEEIAIQKEKELKGNKEKHLKCLLSRKRQIEDFLQKQLNSKRDNGTKKEYRALLEEIDNLNYGG